MNEELTNIELQDENGNLVNFEVITKLDIEGNEYVVVTNKDDSEEEAIVLKMQKEDNNDYIFIPIEDDKEFELVSEAYYTLFEND